MVEKLLNIIRLFIELINTIRGKKADISDQNLNKIRAGLDLTPLTDPEVLNAKFRLDQIASLPEKDRETRASEIRDMERLIKEKAPVRIPSDKKKLLDQIRRADKN